MYNKNQSPEEIKQRKRTDFLITSVIFCVFIVAAAVAIFFDPGGELHNMNGIVLGGIAGYLLNRNLDTAAIIIMIATAKKDIFVFITVMF